MPVSGYFIPDNDLADPEILKSVTRGVYVMQVKEMPELFRFGLIGAGGRIDAPPPDRNNANKRLEQCAGTWRRVADMGAVEFRFLVLCRLPFALKKQIRDVEHHLREALHPRYPRYANTGTVHRFQDGLQALASPRDAFTCSDPKSVRQVARDAIEPLLMA